MTIEYLPRFRKALNLPPNHYFLHIADIISSPNREQFFKPEAQGSKPHTHAARALPIAESSDIVVLSAPLNQSYYQWLRSHGLSTEHVYSYNLEDTTSSLAEIISSNPQPVLDLIQSQSGTAVYLPFYGSEQDQITAEQILGIKFYGSEEKITLQYFDKLIFKNICTDLGIEMVEGDTHDLEPYSTLNRKELAQTVKNLLKSYEKLIIRGTIGSAGRSLFTTDNADIKDIYKELLLNNDQQVLIEPLLNVISSPNDQWIIDLSGECRHLSLTAQLFQGLKHAGNISGQYYSPRIQNYILEISEKIVKQMAGVGYRGVLGIDYIVSDQGIFPIENNARVNGSTYVHALAEQLEKSIGKIECWKFYKAKTIPTTFDQFRLTISEVIYDGKRINSVFPFDCDLLEEKGELTILIFAEDVYHIDYLQDVLSQKGIIRK